MKRLFKILTGGPDRKVKVEKQNIHEVTEDHFQALKAKWEGERKSPPTICKQCEYYSVVNFPFKCISEKAPYTDFVQGLKDPYKINKGHCKYFKKYMGKIPPKWRSNDLCHPGSFYGFGRR